MSKETQKAQERFLRMVPGIMEAMRSHNFEVYFCRDREEISDKVLELIPKQTTVACGNSRILEEIGLTDRLRSGDYQYIERKGSIEEQCNLLDQMVLSKVYVTGVHAVSREGTLVLAEKTGSRIAAVSYGADDVIIIVGMNKIYRTEAEAECHAIRKTGQAQSNYVLKLRSCLIPGRVKVILAAENLGE